MLTSLLAACWSLPGSRDTVPACLEVSSFSAALHTDPAAFPLQPGFKNLAWRWWSPFPSLNATQDQNEFWIAKHISSVRLKNPEGQEATMPRFLLVSVLTQGLGQEHKKITWHCSSRKEKDIHVEDVCLSHEYTGLFWRPGCNLRISPLGTRDAVPMPVLEVFPAIQLSTQTAGVQSAFEAGPCFEQEVGLETSSGPSLPKSCDSEADNLLVSIYWTH